MLILASNSTTLNAERLRGRLAPVLGLGGGGRQRRTTAALTELPDTPAGNTVRAYLKAYNSGDVTVMGEFMRSSTLQAAGDTRTLDQRLEGYKRIHGELGTLKLLGIESAMGDRVIARMATEHGETVTMILEVEAQAPYRLRRIGVEAQ